MKFYFLAPSNGGNWHSPNDVADRFRDVFASVTVNADAAQKQGAEHFAKYRLLLESGLGNSQATSIDELEKRWKDAISIAVVIDDDSEEWFRTIACYNHRLELFFGPRVSGRKHRSLAQRAATALGYVIQSNWVNEGLSDRVIAERLRVSPSTVRYWRDRNGVFRENRPKGSEPSRDSNAD